MSNIKHVLITGGAGYVGAVLVPKLLKKGYQVKVLDLYIYGEDALNESRGNANLVEVKGDIRDRDLLEKEIVGMDAIIHLACISNDPSFELNPELGKSINYDSFVTLLDLSKKNKPKRFIYASSGSVYGIKNTTDVTEDLSLEPLTDYSKYKVACEKLLIEEVTDEFVYTIIRPATVCGYSPRQRMDITVNLLTNHAVNNKQIKVFGGEQMRPSVHIEDMTDVYISLLELPEEKINKKIYNVGYENLKIIDVAKIVKSKIGEDISIIIVPTTDNRSYHLSSKKIEAELGYFPKRTIETAIDDLKKAFEDNKLPNSISDSCYFNIKKMQELNLQ